MNNSEQGRRTGRTSRMLQLAISHMLRGEQVLVVVGGTHHQASDLRAQAMDWLAANGWTAQDKIPLVAKACRINFGAGQIQFVGYRSASLPAMRRPGVFELWDHYALECVAAEAAKQARIEAAQQARIEAMKQIEALMKEHGWDHIELRMYQHGEHAVPIHPNGMPNVDLT